jgi:hypothetical protein
MIRGWTLAVVTVFVLNSAAAAQTTGWRFHWKPGEVLSYRVEQTTSVSETAEGKTAETKSKLNNVKRWQVLGVDADGVATLQYTLASLRLETTAPAGDVLVFDSADPEHSDPQLREQLSRYVGQPLGVLRVNPLGQVIEVKENKFGPASKFEAEPPFVLTFPEDPRRPSWERRYQVTLEPPQGTGEKFAALQKYSCRMVDGKLATVALATALTSAPEAPADQIPLLQSQPEGEIVFDFEAGVMRSARLKIDRELKDHQGAGSTYHFQSTYTETLVKN